MEHNNTEQVAKAFRFFLIHLLTPSFFVTEVESPILVHCLSWEEMCRQYNLFVSESFFFPIEVTSEEVGDCYKAPQSHYRDMVGLLAILHELTLAMHL